MSLRVLGDGPHDTSRGMPGPDDAPKRGDLGLGTRVIEDGGITMEACRFLAGT